MTPQELQAVFLEDRPAMDKDNTPGRLLWLTMGEVTELAQALTAYLANPSEELRQEVGYEMADIVIYLSSIAIALNLNLDDEVRTKLAFNQARFRPEDFLSDHQAGYRRSKSLEDRVKPDFVDPTR